MESFWIIMSFAHLKYSNYQVSKELGISPHLSCHKLYGCNGVVAVVVIIVADNGGGKTKKQQQQIEEMSSRKGKTNEKEKTHARTQNKINFYILMLFFCPQN